MARQHFSQTASRQQQLVELRFVSRSDQRQCFAFPCDSAGRVDLDALNERQRTDYFFARAVMGRDFAFPVVAAQGMA